MNRHAEKPVKDARAHDGEVIASIHYCPGCGKVEAAIEQQIDNSSPPWE
jgi:hypothetical protein